MNSLQFLANHVDKAFSPSSIETGKILNQKSNTSFDDSDVVTRQEEPVNMGLLDQESDYDEFNSDPDKTMFKILLHIIFFLPNNLVIKPTWSILYILCYPFIRLHRLLFASKQKATLAEPQLEKPSSKNNSDTRGSFIGKPEISSTENKQTNRKEESSSSIPTIVEEDIEFEVAEKLEDQMKSPTGALQEPAKISKKSRSQSRTGQQPSTPTSERRSQPTNRKRKYIFPKLLFNFNIQNPPPMPQKTLVLDLDETLIHSLSRHNSSILNRNQGTTIEIKINNSQLATLYHVYKRPYVDEFLYIVKNWYNLVCFTASIKEYADPVINYLEQEVLFKDRNAGQKKKLFSQRFYRDSCIFVEGKGYVKDLTVLQGQGGLGQHHAGNSTESLTRDRSASRTRASSATRSQFDLSKVVIVDNSPISYSFHKDNGIVIEGWINDPDDLELMNLLPLLNSLRFTSDVRNILSLKLGQSSFE
ncbi:hypothetical protein CANARDRAFT_192960 [[Candida] arabinofermentans NRRL YB-2248]|uniref:Mitochondrial import inner membrane translocase subunit TIM50 n=1 Tax=[Candida] arabinofermentans NRRL YB-2248 TaxID=983967 RepID=A0A1E4T8U3_9ASCO|nr:hypothetical protein CANARDRAFT_192960 [[Candida] arabinofermentans NRRL YB-2248]